MPISVILLGIIIFVFGVISIMTHFSPWGYLDLWHYLLLGASLSSLVTGIYFKTNGQKKLAILFLGLFILALLFKIDMFNVWIMLVAMFVFVLGFIIVNNVLQSRRR